MPEKQQKYVQRAINGFLFEIAEGIVAQSTKDKSFEIERENEKQEKYITDAKKKTNDQINDDNVKAFSKYFSNKKYD